MADEKSLICQCIDLANQAIKKGCIAAISIEIGEGFVSNLMIKIMRKFLRSVKRNLQVKKQEALKDPTDLKAISRKM